jgi:hypothetical protein
MVRGRTVRTPKKSKLFLDGLRQTGVISYACKMAGIGHSTAYEWRSSDDSFAKDWNEALEEALDMLELEARRRAHDGLVKKKFKDGEPIIDPDTGEQYYEREYSDTLLIFLMKGGRPEKYRERIQTELSGPGGAMPALNVIINGSPITPAPGSGVPEPSE